MALVLGISCFYHDSAASLVHDGQILYAAQEERFSRKKHDSGFPINAVNFCLDEAGVSIEDVDAVVFYEKPLLKFDRLLANWFSTAPSGFSLFLSALPNWLKSKLYHPRLIRRELGGRYKKPVLFCGHHQSHAASAYYPSPFDEAAILTLDGVGEWETLTLSHGKGRQINILKSLHFPHSLGLLYSAFTYYLGFRVNSGEYKVMGLAPYGEPRYKDLILDRLIDLKDDGSFRLDMRFFRYTYGLTMTNSKFHDLFGGMPRKPEAELTQREMDLAASLQHVTEVVIHKLVKHAKEVTGCTNLCLAGGVALNSVANGKVKKSGLFEDVWVQPASGDAGGALGAALQVAYDFFEDERKTQSVDSMQGALLGSSYTNSAIEEVLIESGAVYEKFEDESELLEQVTSCMNTGQIVGWFQGRMEYGPRALGNRSILGDPRNLGMQSTLNLKIKFRESFRPFAPVVLEEYANKYFELQGDSPYMLVVDKVLPSWLKDVDMSKLPKEGDSRMRKLLAMDRSELPAITHVDNSARIQTVDKVRNPLFYRLLKKWHDLTSCPVLVNTSFNIRGEPIVESPKDAWRCFAGTAMDVLVMGDYVIRKSKNPQMEVDVEAYRGRYPLD